MLRTSEEQTLKDATERHSADVDDLRRRLTLTPTPGPGKSESEKERLVSQRKAREDAAEEQRVARRDQAAATRQAQLDRSAALKRTKLELDALIGNTRGKLRQAVDLLDLDAAQEIALQLLALERVEVELLRNAREFSKSARGWSYYGVGAAAV